MAANPKRITYVAQVARIRIETAIVEVKADAVADDSDAVAKAVAATKRLPEAAWTMQPFDHNDYRPHVQSIISQHEIDDAADEGDPASPAELVDSRSQVRYLLLQANCDTAEADVVLPPWLVTDQPDLLASDLCSEWIASLRYLGLTHMSERLDDLAAGAQPLPSDHVLFAVKQPRKPRP